MQTGDVLRSPLACYQVVKITDKTVSVNRVNTESGPKGPTDAQKADGGLICRKVHHSSGRTHIHISRHECAFLTRA